MKKIENFQHIRSDGTVLDPQITPEQIEAMGQVTKQAAEIDAQARVLVSDFRAFGDTLVTENAQPEAIRLADWRLPDGIRVRLILENTRSAKPSSTGWVLRQNASFLTRPSTCHRACAPSLKKMTSPAT